ncbi:hypothetical protein ABTJ98_20715, partial [Acinetobacter baumannii]
MQRYFRPARRSGLFLSCLLAAMVPPGAAFAAAPDPANWLYAGSDVPHDAAWTFGTLPNGLRYAVR